LGRIRGPETVSRSGERLRWERGSRGGGEPAVVREREAVDQGGGCRGCRPAVAGAVEQNVADGEPQGTATVDAGIGMSRTVGFSRKPV